MKNEALKSGLDQLMIPYDDEVVRAFEVYHQLLESWNNKVNLTSVTAWNVAVSRHYLDSATLVMSERFSSVCNTVGTSLIDVGTGPGLPGIVLKLLLTDDLFLIFASVIILLQYFVGKEYKIWDRIQNHLCPWARTR